MVGLGLAGGLMAPVIQGHPIAQLAGAAEPNALLRERFEKATGLPAFADAEELMARSDVDAVYIATPHQLHARQVIAAASCNKHVVVEKPMALTLADCDAMIEAAARAGITLIVGHTHSFDPAVQFMRNVTLQGTLGRLSMLSMWQFTDFLYRPRRPEELDTALGGGIVYNQLPHQVDIARAIACSDVRSVRAVTRVLDPSRRTEGNCSALLDFEGGAVATLVYSGHDYFDADELNEWVDSTGHRKTPAHGKTRRALQTLDADAEKQMRSERYGFGSGFRGGAAEHQPHFGMFIASYEKGDLRVTPRGVMEYSQEGLKEHVLPVSTTGRSAVLDELCTSILDRCEPVHSGAFAKQTLATCMAMLESSRSRREVQL